MYQGLIERDLRSYGNDVTRPQELEMLWAISDAASAIELPKKVKILHLCDMFSQEQDLEFWTHSPGLPWRENGYRTLGDIKDDQDAIQSVRKFWHFVKYGQEMKFPTCTVFARKSSSSGKNMEVFWEYPATITFGEAMFATSLARAFRDNDTPIAFDYEELRSLALNKIDSAPFIVVLDFKCFDKTIPTWLIDIAFNILFLSIDFSHYEYNGIPDTRKMFHMCEKIKDYFINTPISTPSGILIQKESGIPSGSQFTLLVRSICAYILINYMFRKVTGHPPLHMKVFGSDSIAMSPKKINIMEFQVIAIRLGLKLDINRSKVETDPTRVNFSNVNT